MPPRFAYVAARTLPEALEALARHGQAARVLAGGTDLVRKLLGGAVRADVVVSLGRIAELREIRFDPVEGLSIGALVRLAELEEHTAVRSSYPALHGALCRMATVPVRNMGTLGGNLCNASPCADSAPTLLARDARVEIASAQGERRLDLADFLLGPGVNALQPGELLRRIHIPAPPPGTGFSYQRISGRSRVDMAAASAAARLAFSGERCTEARIVLGSVGPTALRARKAEALLLAEALTPDLMRAAGLEAAREARPISDVRASADWRRMVVAVLVERALAEATLRARGKERT